MESNIRSYWKKAGTHVWDGRDDYIHDILWVVSYILLPCDKVRLRIRLSSRDSLTLVDPQSAGLYAGCSTEMLVSRFAFTLCSCIHFKFVM